MRKYRFMISASAVLVAVVLLFCRGRAEYTASVFALGNKDTVAACWQPVAKADGYRIMADGREIDTLEGRDNTLFLFGSNTYRSITVVPYSKLFGIETRHKPIEEIELLSRPDKPVDFLFSGSEGTLTAEWNRQSGASGFELRYSPDKEMKKPKQITIDDGLARNCTVSDLPVGQKIYASVRSYIERNGKRLYSPWSDISACAVASDYATEASVDPDKPMVALTFDDGPAYDYDGSNTTARILDTLEKYDSRATFFMVGDRVNRDTAYLLEREAGIGCEFGNHTFSHLHYGSAVTSSDISKASDRIMKYGKHQPTVFRCPGGSLSALMRNECRSRGMPLVYWSVDTQDWQSQNARLVFGIVTKYAYDGSIILMHDIYPSTADAVALLVPELRRKGYQLVTVSELLTAKRGEPPKAGEQYLDAYTINNNTK